MNKRKNHRSITYWDIVGACIIIGFIGIFVGIPASRLIPKERIITVTDKNIKRPASNSMDIYMVYGKDDDGQIMVFKDTDSIIPPKFNSSDIYAQIEVGKTYALTVRGFRIRIFSEYENIYKATEIVKE